jgi:light-regulated signal transduction histidine kinase (bacteriophytochrome)
MAEPRGFSPTEVQQATLNLLEDFEAEKQHSDQQQQATFNILDDFESEKARIQDVQRATFNILEDFDTEKAHIQDVQRATFNILEDFDTEKAHIRDVQRATFNILEDFEQEKARVEATQRATLNILEDLDVEKRQVERAEAELKQRAEELGRANMDLERFAHVVSHDLQEPLRTITGYVQLLSQDLAGKLQPEEERFMQNALAGAARMREMILDLLAYSRAGRQELHRGDVDAGPVLADAIANLQAAIAEAGAKVQAGPMPHIHADPRMVVQVFQNLLSNAVKFRGKDPPTVVVEAALAEGEVVFSVADNGIGIAAADIGNLFVPFQRLASAAGRPGSGIGLSTCRRIVERHGGRMWVQSQVGHGSTFFFTFPQVNP